MAERTVSITLQTADRTRMARLTVPRDMRVSDVVKTALRRWSLRLGVHYQVANLTTGRQLLGQDRLDGELVNDNDILVLQPMPTHG